MVFYIVKMIDPVGANPSGLYGNNIFQNLSFEGVSHQIEGESTQIINGSLQFLSNSNLSSSDPGTKYHFYKTFGTVSLTSGSLTDNNAWGGATFTTSGTTKTNTTGWDADPSDIDPVVTVTANITPFNIMQAPSAAQSFLVIGNNLTDNINITAPTDFEVSTDDVTYTTMVSIPHVSGTVNTTAIYLRYNPSGPGSTTGDVTISNSLVTDQTIPVTGNAYTTPTDISLDNSSIDENSPLKSIVGKLSATDSEPSENHTFDFDTGTGDTDNAQFLISGDKLLANAIFDFETKNTYSVRIKTVNTHGGFFSTSLIISINDIEPEPSNDATLSEITLSSGNITFDPATFEYEVYLPNGTSVVPTVGPVLNDPNAAFELTNATNLTGTLEERTTTILVTAEDGITFNTYSLIFSVLPSSDATLSGITVNPGSITFSSSIIDYEVVLPYGTGPSAIPSVTATKNHPNAIISQTDATNLNGTEQERTTTIEVTAEDGITINTYSILFNIAEPSQDATLSDISLDFGSLEPSFSSSVENYTVQLPNGTTTVPTVTTTANDQNATVTINNAVNLTGSEAERTTTITVTAEDGTTQLIYSILFSVAPAEASDNATLSTLEVSQGTLSPAFSSSNENYTVSLPNGTTTVPTVTATANDQNATVTITNATNLTGSEAERTTTITVTAEDGVTQNVYSIVFSVAPANAGDDATLSTLEVSQGTLSPAFSSSVENYTVVLSNGTTTVPTVTATVNDQNAQVSITDAVNLTGSELERTTNVTVTAEDGVTQNVYSIVFSVAPANASNDATLSEITLSQGTLSPAFLSATLDYTVTLPAGTTQVPTVTATTNHSGASKSITDALNLSGTTADRTATVLVIAEDGATQKSYKILFALASDNASDNANLASITLTDGVLTPAFSPAILLYVVNLPSNTLTVPIVTAQSMDEKATISITQGISLTGTDVERTATIQVVAEDGVTEKMYSVVFIVEPSAIVIDEIEIEVFPVPVSGILTIRSDEFKLKNLHLFNHQGRLIKTERIGNPSSHESDLTSLPEGIYLLRMETDKGSVIRKVIIQR
jgi:hypothetical protein